MYVSVVYTLSTLLDRYGFIHATGLPPPYVLFMGGLLVVQWAGILVNGKVYDQVDVVAKGSPLVPVLVYLFLGHHIWLWLNKYQGPPIYLY